MPGQLWGESSGGEMVGGRYRLKEIIGRGSTAVVYRALDEPLDREVAVKLTQTAAADDAELRRSDTEVKLLAQLTHPGLVTLLDAGTERTPSGEPRVFLVMELIDGPDLRGRLRNGALQAPVVAEIGHDLAEALSYIHGRGVVHRDVKPANVLLLEAGNQASRSHAKLTDFGIAWVPDSALTLEDAVSGTPAYLSPEQVRGESIGPASDIYSLGLVLLQCLTGELAFPGPPLESAVRRLTQAPPIDEALDPLWRQLIARMTEIDPEGRPTAGEAAECLYRIAALGALAELSPRREAAQEEERMAEVRSYGILDTPPDNAFDRITRLAAHLLEAPMSTVSIVDVDRIWFLSSHGIDAKEVERDPGLCASAILQDDLWVIPDAAEDLGASTNPLVTGAPGIKFYAAMPLKSPSGANIGTLSVLDQTPRTLTAAQAKVLRELAGIVMDELNLHRASLGAAPAAETQSPVKLQSPATVESPVTVQLRSLPLAM